MSADSDLETLCAGVCSTFTPGTVPSGQAAPYTVRYGGTRTPEDRALTGVASGAHRVWRVLCASNNFVGARTLADAVTAAVDGAQRAGGLFEVVAVSDPLQDTTDPSSANWSATVEVHHHA